MNSLCVIMAVDFIFLKYKYDQNTLGYLIGYQIGILYLFSSILGIINQIIHLSRS